MKHLKMDKRIERIEHTQTTNVAATALNSDNSYCTSKLSKLHDCAKTAQADGEPTKDKKNVHSLILCNWKKDMSNLLDVFVCSSSYSIFNGTTL